MVLGIRHFRTYLYGKWFLLRTDHASLTWLLSFKEPEGQLARWMETLYDFEIRHRASWPSGSLKLSSQVSEA